MGKEENPFETWGYVCKELKRRQPKLAYVSITDPRLEGDAGGSVTDKVFLCVLTVRSFLLTIFVPLLEESRNHNPILQ
jgi:hypothetical protein